MRFGSGRPEPPIMPSGNRYWWTIASLWPSGPRYQTIWLLVPSGIPNSARTGRSSSRIVFSSPRRACSNKPDPLNSSLISLGSTRRTGASCCFPPNFGKFPVAYDTRSRRIVPVEAIDAEILEQLNRVEEGHLTIVQFEDWFVGRTWDERSRLVAELDHTLAEKSLLTEEQLVSELLFYAKAAVLKPASTT